MRLSKTHLERWNMILVNAEFLSPQFTKSFLKRFSRLTNLLFIGVLALLPIQIGAFSPEEVFAHFNARDTHQVNHQNWQKLLKKYVRTGAADGINRVEYVKVNGADKKTLEIYLAELQKQKVSTFNRLEQKAFWINLYNAKTVQLILQNYPLKSIKDIHLIPNQNGPWEAKLLEIESQKISLNDIENHILRPLWKDLRLHFALNCASVGCPNLNSSAFTARNLDSLLNKGAKDFVNSKRGVELKGKQLFLSSIFDWYGKDFGNSDKEILDTLKGFTEPKLQLSIKQFTGTIQYQYDWTLNE